MNTMINYRGEKISDMDNFLSSILYKSIIKYSENQCNIVGISLLSDEILNVRAYIFNVKGEKH